MAEESLDVNINFNLDTSKYDQFEDRVKRGIDAAVRPGEQAGLRPSAPAASVPVRATSPLPLPQSAPVNQIFQEAINSAMSEGRIGAARAIANQAASVGASVTLPPAPASFAPPIAGRMQPGRELSAPTYGAMQPGRPGLSAPTFGAMQPGRELSAPIYGAMQPGRPGLSAPIFGPMQPQPDRGADMRDRADWWASEFARRDRVAAEMSERAERLARFGYGGDRGWSVAPGMTAMQRLRAVGNTQVLGLANYFNLMFGLGEVAKTSQSIRDAQLKASLMPTDIERLTTETAGATGQYGLFGSLVGLAGNVAGGFLPVESAAKLSQTVTLEASRRQSLDTVREGIFRRRNEMAMRTATLGGDPYESAATQARIIQEERHRAASDRYQQLDQQLKEGRSTHWFGMSFLPVSGFQFGIKDESLRGQMEAEKKQQLADMKSADAERAAAETLAGRLRTLDLMGGVASYLDAKGQPFAAQALRNVSAMQAGQISPQKAMLEQMALNAANERQAGMALAQMRGETYASSLARTGQPLAGRLAGIDARYGTAFGSLDPSNPLYAQQFAGLRDSQAEENAVARQERAQQLEIINAQHRAAGLQFAGNPLGAQLEMIGGRRRAAQTGVQIVTTEGLQTFRNAENTAANDAKLAAQQRWNDIQNININQGGRAEQLRLLLAHQPTSAIGAGIVAQARAEEARLNQGGFFNQARQARTLGVQALQLERQNYLEGFVGEERERGFGFLLKPNQGEDPATVLRNLQQNIQGLNQPGQVSPQDVPGLIGQLIKEVQGLPKAFQDAIAN